MNSLPETTFQLEFFANDSTDGTLFGEGHYPIGKYPVTTNVFGEADFKFSIDVQIPNRSFVSATATDPDGNTSEFSKVVMVMGLAVEIVEGDLVMEWETVDGTNEYWIYGAENEPNFIAGLIPQYDFRLTVLPNYVNTWSSPNGIGDTESNWIYLVIAVDAGGQELNRTNRCGEFDFQMQLSNESIPSP